MLNQSVSVIMPVCNTPWTLLWPAVSSVMNQHGWDRDRDRLIIIDDGSKLPDTLECLDNIEKAWPPTHRADVQVIHNKSRTGQASARNSGVLAARSKFIAFLDSDDVWFGHTLMSRVEYAVNLKANFVWSSFIHRLIDHENQEMSPPGPVVRDLGNLRLLMPTSKADALSRALDHNPAGILTTLVSKPLFLAAGGFEPGLVCSEDWLLWRRLLQLDHCKPAWLDEPAGFYHTFESVCELNQSKQLRMPEGNSGFHLDVKDSQGKAGQYLDDRAKARADQWLREYALEQANPWLAE